MAKEKLQIDLTAQFRGHGAFGQLQRQLKEVRSQLDGMRTRLRAVRGMLAGAFAVAGIGGAVGGIKAVTNALDELDQLGKRARTFGLSTDMLQALEMAATEASIPISTLHNSLQAFVKRVGEARAGTGALVSTLKRIDPTLLENIRNARSQEEALRLLADAMRRMQSPADRAALAAAAFSRAGVDMVRVLRQGSDGLDDTMRRAREMGLVIDRDLIANAEEVANKYGLATRVLDVQFKQILVDLAPLVTEVAQTIADLVKGVRGLFVVDNSLDGLRRRAAALRQDIDALSQAIEKANNGSIKESVKSFVYGYDERIRQKREELARIEHEITQILNGKSDRLPMRQTASPPPADTTSGRKESRGRGRDPMAQWQQQLRAFRERISALRIERRAMGLNTEAAARLRAEHELFTAANRLGIPVTAAMRQQIEQEAAAFASAKAALEQYRKQQEEVRRQQEEWKAAIRQLTDTFANTFTDGLTEVIMGTRRLRDAIRGMVESISRYLLRLSLNSLFQRLFGGLFGSLGGSILPMPVTPFARGGVITKPTLFPMARGLGLMGEAGPEAVLPLARGPDGRLGVRAQGGGAAQVNVTMNISTPDAESFRRSRGRIAAELARAVAEGQRQL